MLPPKRCVTNRWPGGGGSFSSMKTEWLSVVPMFFAAVLLRRYQTAQAGLQLHVALLVSMD